MKAERLRPPVRGDRVAAITLAIAFAVFAWLVPQLYQAEIITFDSTIPLLSGLNFASLGLTIAGFLWCWLKDWRWLRGEERDIAYLFSSTDAQNDLKQVLKSKDKLVVETLLDDRIARTLSDPDVGGTPVRESELRAVAAWRSATLGSFGRYASGLLLLMTVLGTFIGVKSSMGPLGQALLQSAGAGTQANALAEPLELVAAAFGANLTALVGAITLGLAAWGLSIGRQNMLARLEQVSSLYVYSRAARKGPAEQLATAAAQIGQAGVGLSAASLALGKVNATISTELSEVRNALAGQLGTLSDSVGDFSASIDDSLKQTRQMLKALLEQQAVQVAEESRKSVDRVERQITDTTVAVQQATALYGTIVGRLQGDVESVTTTVATLRDTLVEMAEQRKAFGHYTDTASRTIDSRLESLETSTKRQLSVSRKTYAQYQAINEGMTQLVGVVTALAGAIAESERRRMEAQETLHEATATRVSELLKPSIADVSVSVSKLDKTVQLLPSLIAESIKTRPGPQAGGGQVGADGQLARAMEQMVAALGKLQERSAQPAWRRLFSSRH